ncbi:MAG: YoaK family protein [Ferruginibacter sp.]
MFKHRGDTRTLSHNLRIASLLSFVAGIVNVAGFLSVQRLTTNVTGHFAFLIDEVFKLNFLNALVFFLYIFFFFLGSFFSNFVIEIVSRRSERFIFVVPIVVEIIILSLLPFLGKHFIDTHPDIVAYSLLFAMGLQNSLVTSISNAVVRTTHLTGLFTDLGIELSQLLFYKTPEAKSKLRSSIRLRLTIIFFFFTGGVCGGVFYSTIQLYVLLIASGSLVFGLIYDSIKFRIIQLKQSLSGK